MANFTQDSADDVCIATIRTLAADVVGAPMGMAPIAHVLFSRFFNANPKNSKWFNRDRFVLSNGCALQYIMLHLLGYKLSMDDLKQFRQVDSLTPGHPETGHTDGIEVTTGPLGQGFANGVGLGIAQAHLAATFNKDGFDIINNYTYVFTGDGCLMEGVASEAASLAGHLQLGNLIYFYDDNHISIDGDTAVAFTENVEQRFLSYGWQVLHVDDGDRDLEGIYNAVVEAQKRRTSPLLFACEQPSVTAPSSRDTWCSETKFGLPADKTFYVPEDTYKVYAAKKWDALFASYGQKYPKEHAELSRRIAGKLTEGWEKSLPIYKPSDAAQASRKLSEIVLTAITPILPELIGGSADLRAAMIDFQPESTGLGSYKGPRYGCIANGMHAYGGVIPFVATFMNFVSYAAGAVRLSALSKHQVIWVATHDSIGLGEDDCGALPRHANIDFWRPADGNETSAAYYMALTRKHTPSILSLSRQNLPNLEESTLERASKGGYVVLEEQGEELTIVSSGSEVSIALEAAVQLKSEGVKVRVVSLPCWSIFDLQPQEYRLSVLRSGAPILAPFGWQKYSHEQFGMFGWGASGPYKKIYEKFGLTGSNIASVSKKVITFYKQKGGEVVSPLVKAL
ncbi:transketolase [Fomitopsis serialis]|uniref:transketolase n=1 Tax=Fomitopsis serialis TaxID=139415 RepID=UPI0020082937|nr:transketolase [Neoantrodia serialis]KAH9934907.1 transketolase [Neoantrodia serialis]